MTINHGDIIHAFEKRRNYLGESLDIWMNGMATRRDERNVSIFKSIGNSIVGGNKFLRHRQLTYDDSIIVERLV